MKWLKRVGLVLVAVLALFVFGWAPYWLAGLATIRRFTYNDRENAGLTPATFELPYEDVTFNAPDGVGLKGWWVPAPDAHGTVVLVHGLNRSRIEMVKKVPFLHKLGWNTLLFDLRHHGESGGDVSSFGFFEKQDVQAAAEDPGVAALVCDSSYRSLRDTVAHHLSLFRGFRWWLRIVPNWPVANEVVFWMGRRGHFDPDVVDVRAAAAHLAGRPCL